jgi:hypothetical protein
MRRSFLPNGHVAVYLESGERVGVGRNAVEAARIETKWELVMRLRSLVREVNGPMARWRVLSRSSLLLGYSAAERYRIRVLALGSGMRSACARDFEKRQGVLFEQS